MVHGRNLGQGAHALAIGVEADQLAEERGVLVLGIVGRDQRAEPVRRLPEGGCANTLAVILVPAGLAACRVGHGRILVLDQRVDLHRDVVEFLEVLMDFAGVGTEIAGAGRDPGAHHAGRGLGDDAQRAAFGIASEQRALRPAQNFDALEVEQGGIEALLAAKIDAIDVDAHALVAGGLVGVERHDAADADGQRRLARFKGRDAQRRNGAILEADQALGMAGGHLVRTDDRNRDGRLLQIGLALGCRHDDGFQCATGRLMRRQFLGRSRLRHGRRQRDDCNALIQILFHEMPHA
jgi:hypothetical protein